MNDLTIKYKGSRARFKYLAWDTDFFGVASYSLNFSSIALGKEMKGFISRVARSLGRSFTVAKVDAACHRRVIDFLNDLGFRFINGEIILQIVPNAFSKIYDDMPALSGGIVIEKAKSVPKGAYLLGAEFSRSRFHLDRNIPKRKADEVWIRYIKNFTLGARRHLFVAKIAKKTAGGIFIDQISEGGACVSNFFSVSVRKEYQRRGIGSALVRCAIDWALRQGHIVTVETQMNNIEALNFYMKNGFLKTRKAHFIFHRWS